MAYHFRNLVFEGGGVKGIGYVGAMEVLEKEGILPSIIRAGGTSAGAINATLLAVGYSYEEQREILWKLDFENFMDDSWGVIRDTDRLINKFGWYKGDFFHEWISERIAKKMGTPYLTFRELAESGGLDLYVYGANLSTRFGKVFSAEHTPTMRIADAVRISMSIPLFFTAVRNARDDVFVDGGLLNNYPVKLFDREKYIQPSDQTKMARKTKYYEKENQSFLAGQPKRSSYVFNKETLGFRLDSKKEIAIFRYGSEPQHHKIDDFFDYIKALVITQLSNQDNLHLHSDDWQRSIYIDTLGVGAVDFKLPDVKKEALVASGRAGAEAYFKWFNDMGEQPVNRP